MLRIHREGLMARSWISLVVLAGLACMGVTALAAAVPVRPVPEKKDEADKKKAEPANKEEAGTFHTIVFQGAGTLNIKQAGRESVTLNNGADSESRVEKGVLYLEGAGNYDIEIKSLTKIVIKNAGNIEAKNLNLKKLEVVLEGAGSINLSGSVEEQIFTLTGAGDFQGKNLKGRRATINLGGAGNAVVNVTERIDAKISGAGSVEYVSRPAHVEEDITGAGQVQPYVEPKQ